MDGYAFSRNLHEHLHDVVVPELTFVSSSPLLCGALRSACRVRRRLEIFEELLLEKIFSNLKGVEVCLDQPCGGDKHETQFAAMTIYGRLE